MFIDSHAHLNDDKLYPNADIIVERARAANVGKIINVGYDLISSKKSVELAKRFSSVYCAVGMHPHDSRQMNDDFFDFIKSVANFEKTVAVGEIGLDFHYDLSPRDIQEKVFIKQLELADCLKLPVIIHSREADALTLKILAENKTYLNSGAILHCYGASAEMVKDFNKLDLFYSFGGSLTFKNAKEKPQVLKAVPREKLLIETDCPYMTPVPFRGRDNEPSYIPLIAEKMAEILGVDVDYIMELTKTNTEILFPKIKN